MWKGSSIKLTDFVSRNPVCCPGKDCQVCLFASDQIEIAVGAVSIEDIQNGTSRMPFYNYPAWKQAQMNDPDLERCFSPLSTGTRLGKKEEKTENFKAVFTDSINFREGVIGSPQSKPIRKRL